MRNEELVAESLELLVNNSRLSMSQIASKWGVSTGLLSQIKNKKKRPSIELGLKILRESGATLEERKSWLADRETGKNEIGHIIKDEKKKRIEYRLRKSFSDMLENNPLMLDIFLDISLMKDKGLSWNAVLKSYGEYGLQLVTTLLDTGLVKKERDRYYIVQDEVPHAIDLENSLGVMKTAFEILKLKAKKDDFRGEFHFDMTDVSPQGYKKLKDLNIEYTRKAVEIIKENEVPRIKGGIRILSQNITAILKSFVLIFLLPLFSHLTYAQGSGITGGGSGKLIQDFNANIMNLRRTLRIEKNGEKLPYKIRMHQGMEQVVLSYQHGALKTPFFSSEKDAVESIVEINKSLSTGNLSTKEARHLMTQQPLGHCEMHLYGKKKAALERVFKQGSIKPLGFKVEASYAPDGTPRFQGIVQVAMPCSTK